MSIASDDPAKPVVLPPELPADPARQAVATITGYIYQFWWSVDAWLRLQTADEVIYLEGAEDLDTVSGDGATTEQIKHEAAGISLNNKRAQKALENFWTVSEKETSRRVEFHYISTAPAAAEQDGVFGDICGMEAWRVAQTSVEMAAIIQRYLAPKLDTKSQLRAFLDEASPELVQSKLIRRFHWFLEQPGIEDVKRSVEDRLTVFLSKKSIHLSYVERVRDRLYAFVNSTVVRPGSSRRSLTAADLLREIDAATINHVAVPALQYQQFVDALQAGAFDPGEALLRHVRLPLPSVPSPLLARPQVVAQVRKLVDDRKTVLLTGTVFKGKTTIAQLVANELCPDAWWFPVSSRSGTETDNLLHALAAVIDRESTPSLVVVDDIDLSPGSHAAYCQSLALVVSRANRSGRGLVLTARGTSSGAAQHSDFNGIETVDVPEMSTEEIQAHCDANGCPGHLSPPWAVLIRGTTGGHPKLVQVRIAELSASNWPAPLSTELFTDSPAMVTARQYARQLLSNSVTSQTAEFLYTAAEATFPLTRPMLFRLIEAIEDTANGGDVVDTLLGKWLELVMPERLRVTPILKGSAAEVWLPERRKLAHRRLYDAISGDRKLDVADAAALLYHAFIAEDSSRLAHCAHLLESINSRTVSSAIYQQLLWLPYVSLLPGQPFFRANPYTSALLRQLQFVVGNDVGSDSLLSIFERWIEEVDAMPDDEPGNGMRVLLWSRAVSNQNPRIPLRKKLFAIDSLRHLTGKMVDFASERTRHVIELSRKSPGGIPDGATVSQFFLSLQASAVRSLDDLSSLLDWLEHDAFPITRLDFEEVLGWPLVDSCGAFVQGAWSARHAEETDWNPTIAMLQRADSIARRFGLVRFGSEVAKAASIVYGEHMADHASAMRVLEEATAAFGDTATLRDQRVNALFQINDDAQALAVWEPLAVDPELSKSLDAFSYRRAGIIAGRLGRWTDAERYFLAGSSTPPELQLQITKFGLMVDASYVVALGGELQRAARMLADVLLELPPVASEDGNESWESLLRVVSTICKYIESAAVGGNESELKVSFGKASEPGLSFGAAQPNQAFRTALTVASVGLIASKLGSVPTEYRDRLAGQRASKFPLVRFCAAKAGLALEFHCGASSGFVDFLTAFERALSSLGTPSDSSQAMRIDEGDTEPTQMKTVEDGWFPALSAAAVCCDDPLQALPLWRDVAAARWGQHSQTAKDLGHMSQGLSMNSEQAWDIVRRRIQATRGEAFGSALMLLRSGGLPPRETLSLQLLVASATVCHPQGLILQETFGRPVARRFAASWKSFLGSPLLFTSPRTSLPLLVHTVSDVELGRASVRELMTTAARAVGVIVGDVVSRME